MGHETGRKGGGELRPCGRRIDSLSLLVLAEFPQLFGAGNGICMVLMWKSTMNVHKRHIQQGGMGARGDWECGGGWEGNRGGRATEAAGGRVIYTGSATACMRTHDSTPKQFRFNVAETHQIKLDRHHGTSAPPRSAEAPPAVWAGGMHSIWFKALTRLSLFYAHHISMCNQLDNS